MKITPELAEKLADCRLDHIAIAVKNLKESKSFYSLLGLDFVHQEEVIEQKVMTAFAYIDNNAKIELLESTDDDGPIGKYISKKGPGLHHICFSVPNLEKKQEELIQAGVEFIYLEPKNGAGNCIVNFIHPKSSGGVLVELSQKRS